MVIVKLGDVAYFRNGKKKNSKFYVSTDNMSGFDKPDFYEKEGKDFLKDSILLSNIRPYLKKIWFSDLNGARSQNILELRTKNEVILKQKFLNLVVRTFDFLFHWINNSILGTRGMPVGDKQSLLNFNFRIPSLDEQQSIIDIIEPIELFEEKIKYLKSKIIYLLKKIYNINQSMEFSIIKNNILLNNKHKNQKKYLDTSMVSLLNVDTQDYILITKNKPSRADLSPINNSLIFSKMIGENKILPFQNDYFGEFVFSTGFFNIVDLKKENDDLLSFLLSDKFVKVKEAFSNGSTMKAINKENLLKVTLKGKILNSNNFFSLFSILIFYETQIHNLKNKIINLLLN